jgi:hypothetical protein
MVERTSHGGPRSNGCRQLRADGIVFIATKRPSPQYGQLSHSRCVTRWMNASTDSTVAGCGTGTADAVRAAANLAALCAGPIKP